ncbi:MBL fold metallo-hydrolase [Actinomadura madurae]|uniref:Ribonuclease Z n=1 Tax=Actinomadura madurae TaxID=1993 RepID=A0A1I5GK96_9ACTN|nr:MBL fold metallo-hydrolase [Actinomadura madurae]SFO36484.1 ribonuclease Z [Actinomadura madurae]
MKLKRLRIVLAVLIAVSIVAAATVYLSRDRIVDSVIRDRLKDDTDHAFVQDKEHIRVLLCGTGSPEMSAARAQACTLVAAGGKLFLFDAGEGTTKSLSDSKVPFGALERVFITHFHSDHFNGLGSLINATWIWGREKPLDVRGPVGLDKVVEGLNSAYALDHGYRKANMRTLDASGAAADAVPTEIEMPPGTRSVRVYDQGGVTIDARLVVHDPVSPAFGYVLGYRGKKVFISGDTEVSPVNLPAMQDADLVVHEAYATHLVRRAIPHMRDMGRTHDAEVAERTIRYHADTIALAKQAQQADVKQLVLTHLTPYPSGFMARRLFTQGMTDHYKGELTLGSDGLLIVV